MSNKTQLQSNNAQLAALIQTLQSKMTGGGLPAEIAELSYGTYTSTSTVSGGNVQIEHGLSGTPHVFAFILDSDFSTTPRIVPDNAVVIGVSSVIARTESGSLKNVGVHLKFSSADGSSFASVNSPSETYAYLGGTIVSGRTYRWVAWRFAV